MTDTPVAKLERAGLADAMLVLGPDAPTLCEGWTNYDMAAHVVVREHNPIAGLGIPFERFSSLHDNAITKAKQRHSFEELVERFRAGPPLLFKPVDSLFNAQEYFIHHEDVRRGGGDGPRPADEIADIEASLWAATRKGAKLAVRKLKTVGVDLVEPGGDVIHAREGDQSVSILGRPGEIVLYLAGRRPAAQVTLEGPADAVAVVEGAKLGI